MKKGFTLIELLSVIILLGIIGLVAVPSVTKLLQENQEKIYNAQIQELKEITEKWAYQNLDLLPVDENGTVTLTLLDLKKSGLVELDLRNPKTKELFPNDMEIIISFINNKYVYEVYGDSGTNITSEFNVNAPTIVLNGSSIEYTELNSEYIELGAIAKDKDNNNVIVNIQYKYDDTEIPSITTNELKTFTVVYSATANGYTSYIVRTIVVRDTTPPDLVIPKDITITSNEAVNFNLLDGVTATDNSGENINVQTSGYDTLLGKHIVSYKACDSNNNCTTKKRIVTIAKNPYYVDSSGANKPELYDKMIPVIYENNEWIYVDIEEKWYDYDAKEWANAVVLNDGVTKNVGDAINVDTDVALMFVWIPRYKYTIFNGNNGSAPVQEINIVFESGTAKTGTVTCTTATSGSGSSSETCSTITNGVSTYTHPAFTFGTQELTGIWVGKFENSTTDETCKTNQDVESCNKVLPVTIKPNVRSWRYANVSNFYTSIGNISNNYEMNVDSHMMKNMEWGAVAYLSHSKYGADTEEVWNNAYNQYRTGCSGREVSAYNESTCVEYNTENGVKSSTTHNIYGVYDMSGGSLEYVMGNIVNSSNQFNSSSGGFSTNPITKYYDSYTYGGYDESAHTTHSRGKLGDATKETLKTYGSQTGGWYGESAFFPVTFYAWFSRGGSYIHYASAGLFYFSYSYGNAKGLYPFDGCAARVVVVSADDN